MSKSVKISDIEQALPTLIEGENGEWFCRPIVIVGDNSYFDSVVYLCIDNVNFSDGRTPNVIVKIDVEEDCRVNSEVLTQYCTLGKELTEVLDESQVYEATHETMAYRKEAFEEGDWNNCILTLLSEE